MKTPEEIKKGIECCTCPTSDCDQCPYHKVGDGDCVDEVKHDALAYIRQLEARVPRWIPVEERLPDIDEEVLVCTNEGLYKVAQYSGADKFWTLELNQMVWGMVAGVTHWMPLPEPPEEG